MLAAALAAPPPGGRPWREFFLALDQRWGSLEAWRRLAVAVQAQPEFTEVVYVYRNVGDPRRIEYKEMLLSDLRARFGELPLAAYLDPALLGKIFGRGDGSR